MVVSAGRMWPPESVETGAPESVIVVVADAVAIDIGYEDDKYDDIENSNKILTLVFYYLLSKIQEKLY